ARVELQVVDARFGTQAFAIGDVIGVEVAGMEASARMGGGEGERCNALATAQLAPGELRGQRRGIVAVDRGDVGEPGRRKVLVEIARVLDVGDVTLSHQGSDHMRSRLW